MSAYLTLHQNLMFGTSEANQPGLRVDYEELALQHWPVALTALHMNVVPYGLAV